MADEFEIHEHVAKSMTTLRGILGDFVRSDDDHFTKEQYARIIKAAEDILKLAGAR